MLLISPSYGGVCPPSCLCTTTRDSLHRASCSDISELYKFTLRQKHHNINILDLSHNNITKLTHELDRLTEVVTLDLSTNGIKEINKFLSNAKKLVHLNLAHNRITKLSMTHLPTSVSSLDLTNNLLQDLPADLQHLKGLEHLEMEGNPLHCSCENIITRDYLISANVHVDDVTCMSPSRLKGQSWLKLKTKEVCKAEKVKIESNFLDMMMGDEPVDAERIGKETTELKSMPLVAASDLEDGEVLDSSVNKPNTDEDDLVFIKAENISRVSEIEGSGNYEATTISGFEIEEHHALDAKLLQSEQIIPVSEHNTTEDTFEGSGDEGSGAGWVHFNDEIETTTDFVPILYTGPVSPYFESDVDENDPSSTTEYPTPKPVSIFMGGRNWIDSNSQAPSVEIVTTSNIARDTTVSEQIRVTRPENNVQASPTSEKVTPHKTGTYVCIAIIIILLVGLIGFAIVRGQMRKRRDRRLYRQQKADVEQASKEMIDMNKSLLGKPATLETPIEKKANGKYELVPTHEPLQNGKKNENGGLGNGGVKRAGNGNVKASTPTDTNQNKNTSIDNNINEGVLPNSAEPQQETSFDTAPSPNGSKRDTHSLSSEDIFVPMSNIDSVPHLNGATDSDFSHPLLNGANDQNTDSDFLSPSRDYVPVYSPDGGRVRIKMTETPKPKTPVLVTRSRSNAGDIIITPSLEGNAPNSTT